MRSSTIQRAQRGFDPRAIPGLQVYYDANSPLGLGVAPPTEGTLMPQWNDLSGNGRHATNADSVTQPQMRNPTATSPRIMDYYAGTLPHFHDIPLIAGMQATCYTVSVRTLNTPPVANPRIIRMGASSSGWGLSPGGSSNNARAFQYVNGAASSTSQIAFGGYTNRPVIEGLRMDGSARSIEVSFNGQVAAAVVAASGAYNQPSGHGTMGCETNTLNNRFGGGIALVLIYNTLHSDAVYRRVLRSLAGLYPITIDRP